MPAGRWLSALMCWIGSQVLPAERRVGPLLLAPALPRNSCLAGWRLAGGRPHVGTKATSFLVAEEAPPKKEEVRT